MFRRYREKAVFYEVSREKELEDIDYMPEIEKMQDNRRKQRENFPCICHRKWKASKERVSAYGTWSYRADGTENCCRGCGR